MPWSTGWKIAAYGNITALNQVLARAPSRGGISTAAKTISRLPARYCTLHCGVGSAILIMRTELNCLQL